ncbi:heat shock protein 60A-like [Drosophila obscura]|uniref:heat shock protein 60A-like n=1 Tax=Drosophila obscura TaxID=7282 RepID=UPI001BB15C93|nr:heat shock protein 60A-like [Drosophila obscura]
MHKLSTLFGRGMPTTMLRSYANALPRPHKEERPLANSLLEKLDKIGSQLVQDIVDGAHQQADGMTTATILGRTLVNESNKYISKGADPKEIRVGIMAAVEMVIKQLNAMARPVYIPEQLLRVAITSAHGDRAIGGLIYQAISKAGLEGEIHVQNTNNTFDVELRFCEAIKYTELAYPQVITAKDIVDEAPGHLVLQRMNAANADIAMASGSNEPQPEPSAMSICNLGKVEWVSIPAENSLLLLGYGDENEIRGTSCPTQQKILQESRMTLRDTRVAVFLVGGSSEGDKIRKKELITDAVRTTRVAIEGGLVPGGGTALIRCMEHLDSRLTVENRDQRLGVDIVRRALPMPCWTIAENAGFDGDKVVYVVETTTRMHEDFGYDVVSGKYCSMSMQGIMDPTQVVCTAITNAAGMAALLITDHEYASDSD